MPNKVFTIDEIKATLGMETKGDVGNTVTPAEGGSLAPSEQYSATVIEEITKSSKLLSILPGNHGTNIPASLVVPVIGEFGFFENTKEWLDTSDSLHYNDTGLNSGSITLARQKLIMRVNVSDERLKAGIDIEAYIRSGIAGSAARTTESIILNSDPATTGNINLNGATLTAGDTRHWFNPNAGIRKTAFDQSAKRDIGALTVSDFFDLAGDLGDNGANPADCLWITNRRTALKASQLPELMQEYVNGRSSTVVKGMETNLLGSDVYIARDLALTGADGKVSSTAGDNVKGSLVYLHKSAPQFGFTDLKIEPKRVEGYGWQFVCTLFVCHGVASKNTAGATDPKVTLGYNVTL